MDYSIANETLTYYQNYAERDSRADYDKGEQDGRQEYPGSDSTKFSTYETYRISEGRTALNEYVRRMRSEVDGLDRKISELMSERDDDYASQKNALYDQKRQALKEANDLGGPTSQRHKELEADHEARRREYQAEEFEAGRPPRINLADPILNLPFLVWTTPYILALLVLATLEVPINARAIELAFEFVPPTSYIISLLVGGIFVLLAHFTGIQLLRITSAPGWVKLWHVLLGALALGFATLMVIVLFEMRGQADLFSNAATGPLTLDGSSVGSPDAAAPLSQSGDLLSLLFTDPLQFVDQISSSSADENTRFAQLGLLLLNVLVFVIGTVLSAIRHDPNPRLERANSRAVSARRQLDFFLRRYRKEVARIDAKYSGRITSTERKADQINHDIIAKQREREQLLQQIDNDMRTVLNVLAQQISAYQRGNRSTRTTREPVYFGSHGTSKIGLEVLGE